MTKILLAGITLATILFALGSSTQGFAMPMSNKAQDIIQNYALTRNATLDEHFILVSDPPTTKGGKPTFHIIPKLQEGIDGITPVQTSAPDLVLTLVKTATGTALKFVPKIQEGIDGVSIPKTVAPQESVAQAIVAAPEKILVSTTAPNGSTVLKLVPKPQEGIDGIPIPKTSDAPMMLVAEPPTSKGSIPVYHLVPVPAPDSRNTPS